MTMQTLTDAEIIPARAEGILALRWSKLAAAEGHRGASPSNRTALHQKCGRQSYGAGQVHHNTKKGLETQAKCLKAINRGYTTVPAIAKAMGLHVEGTRKAIRVLSERGDIHCIGKSKGAGGQANIWAVSK